MISSRLCIYQCSLGCTHYNVLVDKGYEVQWMAKDEYNQMKLSRIVSIVLVVNNKYGSHLSFGDKG